MLTHNYILYVDFLTTYYMHSMLTALSYPQAVYVFRTQISGILQATTKQNIYYLKKLKTTVRKISYLSLTNVERLLHFVIEPLTACKP